MAEDEHPTYTGKTAEQRQMWRGIMSPLITGAVSVAVTVLTLQATVLDTAFSRISMLEDRVASYQEIMLNTERELAVLRTDNEILRLELRGAFVETPLAAIADFIDSLPGPAWCKQVYETEGDPIFVMRQLNNQYAITYGITENRYLGASDAEIFSQDYAADFYINDLEVYTTKSSATFEEVVPMVEGEANATIWKFYVLTNDNKEYICGIQIATEYLEN